MARPCTYCRYCTAACRNLITTHLGYTITHMPCFDALCVGSFTVEV